MKFKLAVSALVLPLAVAGCTWHSTEYTGGTPPIIGRGTDTALNNVGSLPDGKTSIVVDPDGCLGYLTDSGVEWLMDDVIDPKTGDYVCQKEIPAGSVIGNPQITGFPDLSP